MSKYIEIGLPKLEDHIRDDGGKYVRLAVDIKWIDEAGEMNDNLYYEVEEKYGKFFVTELCDDFVLSLIEIAMEKGYSIHHKAPISEDLKYQLERYFIPILSKKFSMLNNIELIGPVSNIQLPTEGAIGTGFSGGVDSFYTVLSHNNTIYKNKNVSYLVLAVNGAAKTGFDESIDEEWFKRELNRFEPIAEELKMKLVGIRSNVAKLNEGKTYVKGGDAIVTLAFIHALRKLFGTYLWAAAWPIEVLRFDPNDGGSLEPFSVPMLSVSGLRVYLAGCETDRIGKEKYIADNTIVQNNLTVCGDVYNCGRCFKCLRTMSELYSIGKLDKFRNTFPVDDYMTHLSSRLAEEFAIDHHEFINAIKTESNINGIKIPLIVPVKKWLFYKPLHFLRKKLRNNKTLIKMFYKYGFDEKLNGKKQDERIVKLRIEGKGKSE